MDIEFGMSISSNLQAGSVAKNNPQPRWSSREPVVFKFEGVRHIFIKARVKLLVDLGISKRMTTWWLATEK